MASRRLARLLLFAVVTGLLNMPLSAAYAASWSVSMIEHTYQPPELKITVGDVVTWTNNDTAHNDDHTVTSRIPRRNESDPNGPLDSGIIPAGESFSYTFTEAGDYFYFCVVHGYDMSGVVRVRQPGAPFAIEDEVTAMKQSETEPASGTVDVLTNDFDREGDALFISEHDTTTTGGGTVVCENGACTYTSTTAACNSNDSFSYTVSDGTQTDQTTVYVRITCGATGEASETQASLRLRRHLRATGSLVTEAAACKRRRTVKLQRSVSHGWKTVASDRTARDGSFAMSLRDRPGSYRAKVPASTLASGQRCKGDTSPIRRHSH